VIEARVRASRLISSLVMVRTIAVLLVVLGLCVALPRILLADTLSQNREYWLKAEEILWDYAPSYPENAMTGEPFDSEAQVFLQPGPDRIGTCVPSARSPATRGSPPKWLRGAACCWSRLT